jgi:hypothetical protein
VVTPDKYHPPLYLELELTLDARRIRRIAIPLYLLLSQVNWSCVLNDNSVDSAVTDIVREAINLAVPYKKRKNTTFPHWFSKSLMYYIKKKNQYFRRYKKLKSD